MHGSKVINTLNNVLDMMYCMGCYLLEKYIIALLYSFDVNGIRGKYYYLFVVINQICTEANKNHLGHR